MRFVSYRKKILQDASLNHINYASTYIGFHEGRRQFIHKVFTRKYVETKKNYLQECMLNTGGVTHTLILVTESKINIFSENMD